MTMTALDNEKAVIIGGHMGNIGGEEVRCLHNVHKCESFLHSCRFSWWQAIFPYRRCCLVLIQNHHMCKMPRGLCAALIESD